MLYYLYAWIAFLYACIIDFEFQKF